MFGRMLAFLGACGLLIVLTGVVPILPAYATGTNCGGTGCASESNGNCKGSDYQPAGACTGNNCGCKTRGGAAGTASCPCE